MELGRLLSNHLGEASGYDSWGSRSYVHLPRIWEKGATSFQLDLPHPLETARHCHLRTYTAPLQDASGVKPLSISESHLWEFPASEQ